MTNSKRGGRSTALRPDASRGGKGGDSSERRSGEKGYGKSDGKKGASKGSGKGKKGEAKNASSHPQERHVAGAKTVQELEAEMLLSKVGGGATTKERREANKHPLEATGSFCEVKKHSDMGCAVVSFKDLVNRDAVMKLAQEKAEKAHKDGEVSTAHKDGEDGEIRPSVKVNGIDVQMRPHTDKAAQQEVKNDIFVAWGRKVEKEAQLPAQTIAEAIDLLVREARGSQLTEGSNHGSPLLGPPNGHVHSMPPMQLPQSLTQLLQPPMVPGPQQQQQVDYAQFMQYAWAAQQQQALQQQQQAAAQQQQAYARQMQPPSSPQQSPQTAPSLGVLETPPRPAGAHKFSAAAAQFTPSPVQQFGNYDQSGYNAINELEQYANYDYSNMGAIQQPKKQFNIVDPSNGQSIAWEMPKVAGSDAPQVPGRKPIKIVDPNSGKSVDTLGMIFTPAEKPKKFSIIDPKSGGNIQM